MTIDVFDIEEFIRVNKLKEITSPILFQRGDVPHPEGLLSNEIFGVTTVSRKETFAYIDLHGYFFHPHVYKVLLRMYRKIQKIISGDLFVSIDENGYLIDDDKAGSTGIEFLYENWEKIKWEKYDPEDPLNMRNERIGLLENLKKNEIFMRYQIVLPPFYRDILSGSSGGETDDINNFYVKLIRLADAIHTESTFDFKFSLTKYTIQKTIVEIYEYFKQKIEKKNGLIRKYLMGKNVDFAVRTVITNSTFHSERPDDMFIDFFHAGIPMTQLCSLIYPFLLHYIKNFFERELFDSKTAKILYDKETDKIIDIVELDSPESYFSDKYIKKKIDSFVKSPESRFDKIEVPVKNRKDPMYLVLTGKRMDGTTTADLAATVSRPMTWTDLLYIACEDIVKDKHALITRYPVLNEFGIFEAEIRVNALTKMVPMLINGKLYPFYPDIDLSTPKEKIASLFNDATQFANSYLAGIDGDYDGDQTTVKIVFTQEANEEISRDIRSKNNFIDSSGGNIRKVGKECLQTFFVLTKDPDKHSKPVSKLDKTKFLQLDPKSITFSLLVSIFGNTVNTNAKKTEIHTSSYQPNDYLILNPGEYSVYTGKEPIRTTVGRLFFNKIMVEGLGFQKIFPYQNQIFTAGEYGKFDLSIANALKEDVIGTEEMVNYINTRDWFGFQMHGVITTSFTPGVLKVPEKTKALKKELFTKYEKEISEGNTAVIGDIEKKLVNSMLTELGDDIGLDLYQSGARGSVNNHLKNIMLTRGAVKNPNSGKYEIITNSLMDGLTQDSISIHSNMIISGAFPKAVCLSCGLKTM